MSQTSVLWSTFNLFEIYTYITQTLAIQTLYISYIVIIDSFMNGMEQLPSKHISVNHHIYSLCMFSVFYLAQEKTMLSHTENLAYTI